MFRQMLESVEQCISFSFVDFNLMFNVWNKKWKLTCTKFAFFNVNTHCTGENRVCNGLFTTFPFHYKARAVWFCDCFCGQQLPKNYWHSVAQVSRPNAKSLIDTITSYNGYRPNNNIKEVGTINPPHSSYIQRSSTIRVNIKSRDKTEWNESTIV